MNPNPWSYKYIRTLAEEASERAMQKDLHPVLVSQVYATWKNARRFNIPFLGDYVPAGWTRIDEEIEPFFVDCSGRARPGVGTAITAYEFSRRVKTWIEQKVAFGVIECGQTQALVAVYRKDGQ